MTDYAERLGTSRFGGASYLPRQISGGSFTKSTGSRFALRPALQGEAWLHDEDKVVRGPVVPFR